MSAFLRAVAEDPTVIMMTPGALLALGMCLWYAWSVRGTRYRGRRRAGR